MADYGTHADCGGTWQGPLDSVERLGPLGSKVQVIRCSKCEHEQDYSQVAGQPIVSGVVMTQPPLPPRLTSALRAHEESRKIRASPYTAHQALTVALFNAQGAIYAPARPSLGKCHSDAAVVMQNLTSMGWTLVPPGAPGTSEVPRGE